jgi:hypothetical protein
MPLEEFILDQIRSRSALERDRWDFVFGNDPKWLTNKGKNYLLNFKGMKEAYDEAKEKCPIAADAIVALVWNHIKDLSALELMTKDYDKYNG